MESTNSLITTVTVPIAATDRKQAAEFAGQQPTPEKGNQVYRNTLAVLVTCRYLQMLSISSELALSQSWDWLERWLQNIADLYIPEFKCYVECRAVAQGETRCFVPEEVQSEAGSGSQNQRIGYIFVQLDEPYREGVILGFLPRVSVTELPLSYLQPLDVFIDCLTLLPARQTNLSDWRQGIFAFDWQPCRDILKPSKRPIILFANPSTETLRNSIIQLYRQTNLDAPQTTTLPANFDPSTALVHLIESTQNDEIRAIAAELLWEIDPEHPASLIVSAKDLGMYLEGHAVALMVGMLPKLDGRQLILLRLYPIQNEPYLPTGLKLAGFDVQENELFEIESRLHDNYIQFKFIADPGDCFSVKVSLHDASVIESFCV